jgi:hypothetical protein
MEVLLSIFLTRNSALRLNFVWLWSSAPSTRQISGPLRPGKRLARKSPSDGQRATGLGRVLAGHGGADFPWCGYWRPAD